MKIEVSKSELEAALVVSSLTVSNGSDLSGHYVFRYLHKIKAVEVLSYSHRLFSRALLTCSYEVKDEDAPDAFTVESWRLSKWLSGVSESVLTLSADDKGDVTAKAPKSKIHLRSLDASKFPYWDAAFEGATEVGDVASNVLARAFGLSKGFISSDDTNKPEICQAESVNGVLQATDRKALALVEVPFLAQTNLRIAGKDIGVLVRFLNLKSDVKTTKIFTGERSATQGSGSCAFFIRPDGSYLGISKPTLPFPTLKVDQNAAPDAEFDLDMGDFGSAVAILSASAPKSHEAVKFKYLDGKVILSMPSEAGGDDEYPLSSSNITNGDIFADGFTIDYPYLKSIAEAFGLSSIQVGVTKRGKGGFISVKHVDDEELGGNKYFTVVVWKS